MTCHHVLCLVIISRVRMFTKLHVCLTGPTARRVSTGGGQGSAPTSLLLSNALVSVASVDRG